MPPFVCFFRRERVEEEKKGAPGKVCCRRTLHFPRFPSFFLSERPSNRKWPPTRRAEAQDQGDGARLRLLLLGLALALLRGTLKPESSSLKTPRPLLVASRLPRRRRRRSLRSSSPPPAAQPPRQFSATPRKTTKSGKRGRALPFPRASGRFPPPGTIPPLVRRRFSLAF